MKKTAIVLGLSLLYFIPSFGQGVNEASNNKKNKGLEVAIQRNEEVNRFADLKILKYDASSINDLTTQQKELVYYLSQAALSGREITYAQNYKHNIFIKRIIMIGNLTKEKKKLALLSMAQ